jgi:hypothetical protein
MLLRRTTGQHRLALAAAAGARAHEQAARDLARTAYDN